MCIRDSLPPGRRRGRRHRPARRRARGARLRGRAPGGPRSPPRLLRDGRVSRVPRTDAPEDPGAARDPGRPPPKSERQGHEGTARRAIRRGPRRTPGPTIAIDRPSIRASAPDPCGTRSTPGRSKPKAVGVRARDPSNREGPALFAITRRRPDASRSPASPRAPRVPRRSARDRPATRTRYAAPSSARPTRRRSPPRSRA